LLVARLWNPNLFARSIGYGVRGYFAFELIKKATRRWLFEYLKVGRFSALSIWRWCIRG
jgi:hypothetical protein